MKQLSDPTAKKLLACSEPCESHLIDALHSALLQVRFGTQEVGMLGVIHRLLKINIDAICGPRRSHWMGRDRKQRLLPSQEPESNYTLIKCTALVKVCLRVCMEEIGRQTEGLFTHRLGECEENFKKDHGQLHLLHSGENLGGK